MTRARVTIFDTTLRDGEQSPGIALSPADKVDVARQLETLGVDVVEAGFPVASPGDFEGVRAVAAGLEQATVCALARTRAEDVDAAAGALAGARRSRIHVFVATSALHMERKLRLTPDEVLAQAIAAVARARARADEVEFSCEDATRSDPAFVARVCGEVVAAGATTVNLPDTVGYCLPEEYAAFLREVLRRCPELAGVTLSVHCHDDLGLAVANSIAGVAAGARQVECTVNGIGERAGNAALEEIAMALRVRADLADVETGIRPAEIGRTSRLVAERTGYPVPANKAIVGANAFAHESGIHQHGVLEDRRTYEIIDPAELGLVSTLPLGKHSGRRAFALACADAGVQLAPEELDGAFARFKRLADERPAIQLFDVLDEVMTP